ncbi:hypothetical protein [Arthrobacter subterraneus]|uniref:hypothetical protein n=1 Tax=Arthrobacter subterraneus TaxID=335973 RepID=UPI00381754F5
MVRAVVAKTVAVMASVFFASLVALWFGIKIVQSFEVGAAVEVQLVIIPVAVLLFAPFPFLIFLSAKPRTFFKVEPWWGGLFPAGLAFLWFFCALFISLGFGFGGF